MGAVSRNQEKCLFRVGDAPLIAPILAAVGRQFPDERQLVLVRPGTIRRYRAALPDDERRSYVEASGHGSWSSVVDHVDPDGSPLAVIHGNVWGAEAVVAQLAAVAREHNRAIVTCVDNGTFSSHATIHSDEDGAITHIDFRLEDVGTARRIAHAGGFLLEPEDHGRYSGFDVTHAAASGIAAGDRYLATLCSDSLVHVGNVATLQRARVAAGGSS